jgi:hypothetical protein
MDEPEEWRVIDEFPHYAVSSNGLVKRIVPDQKGRMSGNPLKATTDTDGYLQVNLFRDARAHTRKIHRLVCGAFHGPSPSKSHEGAHGDGNILNNSKGNLRWATAKENAEDRELHGMTARGDRHPARIDPRYLARGDDHWSRSRPEKTSKGEMHGCAKLTDADIGNIRSDSRPSNRVSQDYGVTPTTICHIRNRKTWRHLP